MTSENTNDNLDLWSSVEVTDIKHTRHYEESGAKLTHINATYQKKRATEMFGPFGIDWGIEIGSEQFDTIEIDGVFIVTYRAVLYYPYKEKVGRLPISSSVRFSYIVKSKGYRAYDTQYTKKLRTDAITKGLSELGFSADIYIGMYEDSDYINERMMEQQISDADNREAKIKEKREDFKSWLEQQLKTLSSIKGDNDQVIIKSKNHVWVKAVQRLRTVKANSEKFEQVAAMINDVHPDIKVDLSCG